MTSNTDNVSKVSWYQKKKKDYMVNLLQVNYLYQINYSYNLGFLLILKLFIKFWIYPEIINLQWIYWT